MNLSTKQQPKNYMKKTIILILTLALCSTVNAEIKRLKVVIDGENKTWQTTKNNQKNGFNSARNEYAAEANKPVLSEAIQVELGEKLELIDSSAQFDGGDADNENIFLDVLVPEFGEPFEHAIKFSAVTSKTKYGGHLGEGQGSNFVFYGPCKIRLGPAPRHSISGTYYSSNVERYDYTKIKSFASATFKISDIDDSGSTGRGSNYSLVIPETTGDATLVLESSDDLVNWATETLGDKPKGNRKKFYRLRAKKD